MRMPGMDGDALLAEVRRRYPQVVRVVLTGQCTREAMVRLASLAHRILTKPCDPGELRAAVLQASSLQDLLHNPPLAAVVGRLGGLPSPPHLYARILAALDRPGCSPADVGPLLAQDVGVVAKLLQVTNSALFGGPGEVTDVTHVVQRLGMETTRALLLAADIFTRYDPGSLGPFSIDDLWTHSRSVAALATGIARAEGVGGRAATDAGLAGLLHDVGRLALASQLPEEYREVLRLASAEGLTLVGAERRVVGATHAEVGAYLLGLWGIPTPLVEAVAWHHAPADSRAGRFTPLTAVHAAEALLAPGEGGPPDGGYLGHLGLGDRVPRWAAVRDAAGTGAGA
jgi:HD-like signal output (HDOD) protein